MSGGPETALTRQEGGNHYVTMKLQPFPFAMANQWDSTAFSILKYASRHRAKNGLEDLKKARHIVDIRESLIEHALSGTGEIPMAVYVEMNQIADADAEVLMALEGWVEKRLPGSTVARLLDGLIAEYDLPSS